MRGLKGVQGAKSPAGVWGVPSFSFSLLAAAGGKRIAKVCAYGGAPLQARKRERKCIP